ncbi:MAG: DNA gyrase inhibitor YacG [Gammaproteobacteria bacterium]
MSPVRVKCPTCGRQIEWSETATFRPFCSDRCRLIDLGAWLSEQRSIPGETAELPPDSAPGDEER